MNKIFEHDGYFRIDPITGVIEVLDKDGKIEELAAKITTETGGHTSARKYVYAKINVYELSNTERETARFTFGRGQFS
jgi:hypothetical protein